MLPFTLGAGVPGRWVLGLLSPEPSLLALHFGLPDPKSQQGDVTCPGGLGSLRKECE